jgi:hypothetical protein
LVQQLFGEAEIFKGAAGPGQGMNPPAGAFFFVSEVSGVHMFETFEPVEASRGWT